jgi:pyridoxamine 5'-phosphate oxidase
MNLGDFRENYERGALDRSSLDANPIAQFESWFRQVIAAQPNRADANAMTLATADKSGRPSSRIVLLKAVDERGFSFFTNYDSRKGTELSENPNAALTFFWSDLERQVCVAGAVTKLPVAESEAYFKSRPRGSQLAAWASEQSQPILDRATLEANWHELEKKFPTDIPLPPNWGGFILKPERIEFWQGRPSRLHDRFSYTRQADNLWNLERLAP